MADNNTEKQRVQELTDILEQGLQELFNSDSYRNYLATMSKFHNYSFNNTLLIAMQKPDATLVAGYKAWQKNFERHVNKGEKAIRILAPAPYKIKEERDKIDPVTQEILLDKDGNPKKEEVEITIPAFRAVSVFDVNQLRNCSPYRIHGSSQFLGIPATAPSCNIPKRIIRGIYTKMLTNGVCHTLRFHLFGIAVFSHLLILLHFLTVQLRMSHLMDHGL